MASVFLNLYLWRIGQDLRVNANYQWIVFATSPLFFALGGWFVKKKDRIVIYRVGIALVAFFFLLVNIVQEQVVNHYGIFAVIYSMVNSFYWIGYLTLMYDVSNENNRMRFLATNLAVFTLANLSGPVIAGNIIYLQEGLRGYTIVFLIATCLFVIATLISFRIPSLQLPPKPLYFKQTFILIWKNHVWTKNLVNFIIIGTFQGILGFLPNILLFQVVPREDLIGYLGMMYSSMTIGMSWIVSRFAQPVKSKMYLLIAAIMTFIGGSILAIDINLWSIILFMSLYSLSVPLQWSVLTTQYFKIISRLPMKGNMRVESLVVRETALNVGRLFAVTLLIAMIQDGSTPFLTSILMLFAALQFINVWIFKRIDHKRNQ